MKIWHIEAARQEHVMPIAKDMRAADIREVRASNDCGPEEALRASVQFSTLAWTCFVGGVPSFMWGVARKGCILSEVGAPWLLGTNRIYAVNREFLKQSRGYINKMHEQFSRLENYVHVENRLSIRWLTWCGFTVDKVPVMIRGEEFYHFWRVSDV